MSDPHPPSDEAQILRAVVADCVERFPDEGQAPVEAACRAHPELADEIRARIRALDQVGLLSVTPPAAFPDRLGSFRLLERLGGGGMGVVYLAFDEHLGRRVALKLIRPEHLFFEGARDRFRREVEAVARLKHPAIVPVYSVSEAQGTPFFAMEHVEGVTLAQVLQALPDRRPEALTGADLWGALRSRIPGLRERPSGDSASRRVFEGTWTQCCLAIARDIADALHHAHEQGVLHRDVKPSNVMLTPAGRALLIDFGLASVEGSAPLTRSLSQLGSLAYMAPEQLRGGGEAQVTERSDLYALGVVLHESFLTLATPDPEESPIALRRRILEGARPAPRTLNPAIPWDAETVCLKATDPDPAQRYATCADLARDLDNVLDLRPIAARRPPPSLRARRWLQRHPRTTVAAVLALASVALGSSLLFVQARRAESQIRMRGDALLAIALSAKADSDELWPALPARVPRMDAWLHDFAALEERVPAHAARLGALQQGDTQDADAQWAIETLTEITTLVRTLTPVARAVAGRRAFAQDVARRSLTEPTRDWERARAEIADPERCPRYAGLRVAPQLGLVPLGRDPDSGLHEFAHLASGEVPKRDAATGRLGLAAEHGIVLVLVPGGTFRIGSVPAGQGDGADPFAHDNEQPAQDVTLAPFFIAKHEVTQAQWQRCTGQNPSAYRAGLKYGGRTITALHPVERISHDEAARWLVRMALELPTEAQWEYAARAGTRSPWWCGDVIAALAGKANVGDSSALRAGAPPDMGSDASLDDGFPLHAPVGSFPANGFGLHDTIGNVQEWCLDFFSAYGDAPPRAGDGLRPRDPASPAAEEHVIRGGSYANRPADCRAAWRSIGTSDNRSIALGVRAARALEPGAR